MKSKIDIQFGARIAELRKQLNISQEELAERCGVHRTYIGLGLLRPAAQGLQWIRVFSLSDVGMSYFTSRMSIT